VRGKKRLNKACKRLGYTRKKPYLYI